MWVWYCHCTKHRQKVSIPNRNRFRKGMKLSTSSNSMPTGDDRARQMCM